jgi:hypothetical protein
LDAAVVPATDYLAVMHDNRTDWGCRLPAALAGLLLLLLSEMSPWEPLSLVSGVVGKAMNVVNPAHRRRGNIGMMN